MAGGLDPVYIFSGRDHDYLVMWIVNGLLWAAFAVAQMMEGV